MTDKEIFAAYNMAYKTAGIPAGRTRVNPVPLMDKVRAFFSRKPAGIINRAGNAANPMMARQSSANANTAQNLRKQLLSSL